MRRLHAIPFRMIGIFLLLILAAMMFIGGYLWVNLERFYSDQHTASMLRSVRAYINPAQQYLHISREIVALRAEIALLQTKESSAEEDEDTTPIDLTPLYLELAAFEEDREIYRTTLIDLSNLGQSETAEYFQVAVLDSETEVIVKSRGVTYLDDTGYSLFLRALHSGETQAESYQRDRYISVIAYPLLYNDVVLGLIYIEAEATGLEENMAALRDMLMVATLAALLLTSVMSAILANGITSPIVGLTRRAQSLAMGDYTTIIEVGSQDEVGHLAETFNILTLRLKETIEEIADEQGKIAAMLNYMTEGVIAVDDMGLVIHINPSARRMFALTDEQAGIALSEILGTLEQELGWRRALTLQEMVASELVLPKERGGLALRTHSAPFFTTNGQAASGVVVVITDTTEELRLEETRRDFIANVSHELRTPLTTVKSYVETLLGGTVQEEELANRFLNVVLQEADRMSRLVSELLIMAQLDAPTLPESLLIQDLKHILGNVSREIAPQFKDKEQYFSVVFEAGEALVLAPQDRIEQVCLNLLSNACKYTPPGGEVVLQLNLNPSGNEIIIRDNGIGIPQEHLPRLFERFYRVDKARSREQGGTGLGLAIAKQIIEKLGGSIRINSIEGEGTEVIVWLPKPEHYAVWGGERRV
jgi:two-component system sensor histidine kinase VicK